MIRVTSFLGELRRRKVWLVGGVYIVSSWIIAQVASLVLPNFAAPGWVMPVLLIVLGLGLPLAIVLAWAQETQAPNAEPEAKEKVGDQATMIDEIALSADLPEWNTRKIAVLPFDNFTDDPALAHLADGFSEDIITYLSTYPSTFVKARNSSFQFKGSSMDVGEIGRQLDVGFVVEGSIRLVGDMLRITAQLIETEHGNHVWADRFDSLLADINDTQDVLMLQISQRAFMGMVDYASDRLQHVPDDELPAYGLALRARNIVVNTIEDQRKRRQYVVVALEKAPDMAALHSILAIVVSSGVMSGFSDDVEADIQTVDQYCDSALRIGSDGSLQLQYVAYAYSMVGMFHEAMRTARRMDLTARASSSKLALARICVQCGLPDEALEIAELHRSRHESAFNGWDYVQAIALASKADFEAAVVLAESEIVRRPQIYQTWHPCINALAVLGRMDEAAAALARARQIRPDLTLQIMIDMETRLYETLASQETATRGLKLLMAEEKTQSA